MISQLTYSQFVSPFASHSAVDHYMALLNYQCYMLLLFDCSLVNLNSLFTISLTINVKK